jgi:predicted permease
MWTGRRGLSDELREEIDAHLEMEIQENLSHGMPAEEARLVAHRNFGNKTSIQEGARGEWLFETLESFANDLGYASRTLRKNPAFAVSALLTLAIGIGGNTAMFTVIRGVLLKPLGYREPDRLVRLSVDNPRQNYRDIGFSQVRYEELKSAARSFTELGAFFIASEHLALSGNVEPEQLTAARVSANFLQVLGVKPLLGRSFLPSEDRPGGHSVALISAHLWKQRFGGDRMVVGTTVTLDAAPCTIVGVLPEQFEFPASGFDVWVTRPSEYSAVPSQFWRRIPVLIGFGRLKPNVSFEQARAELGVLNRQYAAAHPGDEAERNANLRATRLRDQLVAKVRTMLWLLFGAVGFVLIIACANVASLLLARASSRSREFAVRAALGAGRGRLIRQLLAESLLLAFASSLLGVLLAQFLLSAITRSSLLNLPRTNEIHLDGMVLAFTVVLSIGTGAFFGLFPSLQASRPNLTDILRERTEGAGQATFRRAGTRSLLVVGQVALSVILLIGAGLLMKSFARLHSVDPGFKADHLLTMQISLPPKRYDTAEKKQAFFSELVRRVEAIPGVRGATASLTLPMFPKYAVAIQVTEHASVPIHERPDVRLQSITPGYFRTTGIPLRRGREFTERDGTQTATLALMINESFARRFWPDYPRGRDPIGQHILIGNNQSNANEVVGIASDAHESGLAGETEPEVYLPDREYPLQTAGLVVRTVTDPLGFVNAIRRQVLAIDPGQPVSSIKTMNDVLESSVGQQRVTLLLLASFSGVALLLAVIGIYGVISYSVLQRTAEVGIRRALGAQSGDILRLVLAQGLGLALIGVAIGVAGAFALTRLMEGMLFRLSATDPTTFAGIAGIFVLVALLASYLPARRAVRIDPMEALR